MLDYASRSELQPSEAIIFARHIASGQRILDIGVGGGRTAMALARDCKHYIGVDYSESMVEACRSRFPKLKFDWADARDLSAFSNETFDIVVFSFNGIDCLPSESDRDKCMNEINRVLVSGGKFIFSSHNAKALIKWPDYRGSNMKQVIWRTFLSIRDSIGIAVRNLLSVGFWRGEGYALDLIDGGILIYESSPKNIKNKLSLAGFRLIDQISAPSPKQFTNYFSGWWYYVGQKTGNL